jgi:class 3 adenylate cyclase
LFLEALLERGSEARIVLPYGKKQFVRDNVRLVPGTEWPARFERVLKASDVVIASNQRLGEGGMSFDYANLLLHGLAQIRARQMETELVPLAVWDRKRGDGDGGTASAIEQWQARGLRIEVIDLAQILRNELPALIETPGPVLHVPRKRGGKRKKLETRIRAMLFADAVKFSKLTEQQIPRFLNQVLGGIANLIKHSSHPPLTKNTWGDGLYLVFADVRHAGEFALELCDLIGNTEWIRQGLPKEMNLRIALHAGPVYSIIDPVTGLQSYTGTHVSRAARIEPITPSGQVYASQAFAALAAAQGVTEFTCDYVGQAPLAKGYGTFATFHVRRVDPRSE